MLPLGGGGGMLFAARHELESDTRVQLLSIQQRELEFFLNACYYIARLSALIAGYAYTALIYTKYIDADLCDPDEILCAEMNYPFCLTLTFGLSTYCLWGAMLITLLAPAHALRGPQGSVHECVQIIVQEYQCMIFVFGLSLVMLLLSIVIWSMTQRLVPAAILVILVAVASFYLIFLTSARALKRFNQTSGGRAEHGSGDLARMQRARAVGALPRRPPQPTQPMPPTLTPQPSPLTLQLPQPPDVRSQSVDSQGLSGSAVPPAASGEATGDVGATRSQAERERRLCMWTGGSSGAISSQQRVRVLPSELTSRESIQDALVQQQLEEDAATPAVRATLWRSARESFLDLGRLTARSSRSSTNSAAHANGASPRSSGCRRTSDAQASCTPSELAVLRSGRLGSPLRRERPIDEPGSSLIPRSHELM